MRHYRIRLQFLHQDLLRFFLKLILEVLRETETSDIFTQLKTPVHFGEWWALVGHL